MRSKLVCLLALCALLFCRTAPAAIAYVGVVAAWGGTTPATSGSFSPSATNSVLLGGYDYSFDGSTTITFSGTGGSYVSGATFTDSTGYYSANGYLASATAGAQTATITSSRSGDGLSAFAAIYSGAGSIALSHNSISMPGIGTGAIVGTAVVVPSGSTLVAVLVPAGGTTGFIVTAAAGGTLRETSGAGTSVADWSGSGSSITPAFTDTGNGAAANYDVYQFLLTPSAASCTNYGYTSAGAITIPTASSTSVWLKGGTFGTVDCSTTNFWQPKLGVFGAN